MVSTMNCVLILVLGDDGVVEEMATMFMTVKVVLILVLGDDGVVVDEDDFIAHLSQCLDPCFGG